MHSPFCTLVGIDIQHVWSVVLVQNLVHHNDGCFLLWVPLLKTGAVTEVDRGRLVGWEISKKLLIEGHYQVYLICVDLVGHMG
jgi:hypothetical protein